MGALADAVRINNHKIDLLQSELNKKPDDVEVKLITGMATAERQRHLKWAVTTAVLASILSGVVAYKTAEMQGHGRCKVNAQNIQSLVNLLESIPDPTGRFQPTIDDLKSNRNEC